MGSGDGTGVGLGVGATDGRAVGLVGLAVGRADGEEGWGVGIAVVGRGLVGSAVAGDGTGEAPPFTKSSLHTQKRNTAPYSTREPPIFTNCLHFLGPIFS